MFLRSAHMLTQTSRVDSGLNSPWNRYYFFFFLDKCLCFIYPGSRMKSCYKKYNKTKQRSNLFSLFCNTKPNNNYTKILWESCQDLYKERLTGLILIFFNPHSLNLTTSLIFSKMCCTVSTLFLCSLLFISCQMK